MKCKTGGKIEKRLTKLIVCYLKKSWQALSRLTMKKQRRSKNKNTYKSKGETGDITELQTKQNK